MNDSNLKFTNIGKPTPLDSLNELLSKDMHSTNQIILKRLESDVELIPQIAHYIIAAGGKRLRPLLTLACAKLFQPNIEKAHLLAAAVEFIHTATLLHDDVVDESEKRRGQKSSHVIFGNESAILVGDFLFARSFELMVETRQIKALEILSKASTTITQGEVKQLSMMRKIDMDVNDYLEIVSGKTAALFAAACSVGSLVTVDDTKFNQALYDYGLNLGISFQVIDDLLDYSANLEKLGKQTGDDLREGKMTLPVILAYKEADDKDKATLRRIIESEDHTRAEDFPKVQNIMAKLNIDEKTRAFAKKHCDNAHQAIEPLPESPVKALLGELLDYSLHRLN